MGPPLPVPCPLYLLNNTRAVEAIGDDTHDELKPAINVLKNPLDLPDFETQLENTRSGFLLKFSSEAAKLLIIWKNFHWICSMQLYYLLLYHGVS